MEKRAMTGGLFCQLGFVSARLHGGQEPMNHFSFIERSLEPDEDRESLRRSFSNKLRNEVDYMLCCSW